MHEVSSTRGRALQVGFCAAFAVLIARAAIAGDLPPNWPMPPSELERRFASETFRVREFKAAGGGGKTGALKMTIEFPDGRTVDVKWKSVPPERGDGLNNSPRKELATYEVQKWIVDENNYIVPTSAFHCIDVAEFRKIDAKASPTFAGTSCVLGLMSVWMQEVTAPKKFYDEERFENDARYARFVADLNLLTYLVEHRDTRPGNVLLSTVADDPRLFLIDNGISFDLLPWNLRVFNWFLLRVPWLRRESVERLRNVHEGDLQRLTTVAELEAGADGMLRRVSPGSFVVGDDDDGARRHGNRVQFGLTEDEIEDLEERIEKLLSRVDSGKQKVR